MPLKEKLSWELPCEDGQVSQGAHPERNITMSRPLYDEVREAWPVLKTATDVKSIIPNLDKLTEDEAITCFCELLSTVAEYESSWDPTCAVKDVNGSSNLEDLATGLFQMNASQDQASYHTRTKFKHSDLLKPEPNIKVAVAILVYLVQKRGKITYSTSEKSKIIGYFFATLLTDGAIGPKVLASAKKRIASFGFGNDLGYSTQFSILPDWSGAKWISYAIDYLGLSETDPTLNKLLVPHWAAVGLPKWKTLEGDERPWCSNFADWLVSQAGYEGTHDAEAKSWRTWGKASPYWFGAILGLRHASGGSHVTFFLYWIDKELKLAACLGGNQTDHLNVAVYNLSGNDSDNDTVVNGPRWPTNAPDGQAMSSSEARKLVPFVPVAMGSTR
ncbi:transglycosylase SLT domain-containing protein [Mesorhizobium sp. M0955]|uniref:transglycosylase SLT domain-containing protein n=1 Tax=Mesorhizobium sp. M0955 TaxID=2957033 RepID=UPI00333A5485